MTGRYADIPIFARYRPGLYGVTVNGGPVRFRTSYVIAAAWAKGAEEAEPSADVRVVQRTKRKEKRRAR